jgi:hypothetical protein
MRVISLASIMAVVVVTCGSSVSYAAEPVGEFYNVPVKTLNVLSGTTSDTAQLLVYRQENGTPAIQMHALAERDTVGFVLKQEDMPPVSPDLFAKYDEIVIPYWPTRQATEMMGRRAIDLLSENQKPKDFAPQVLDITNSPLDNIELQYVGVRNIDGSLSTETVTGTIRTSRNGLAPIYAEQQNWNYSRETIEYTVNSIEPDTGAMVLDIAEDRRRNFGGEHNRIILPLLSDWNSSSSKVAIFSGKVLNSNGEPAGGAKFRLAGSGRSRDLVALYQYATGPGGEFKLAFEVPVFGQLNVQILIDDGDEVQRFELTPSNHKVINLN